MTSLKTKLYRLARGRATVEGEVNVPLRDVMAYLWRRGALSYLRGLLWRARFGACGGRLFVGRRAVVHFPRYVSVGRNVYIGAGTSLSGLSTGGIRLGDDVRIREDVWIQATSTLDHPGVGLTVGDGTYVGPRCLLGAGGGIVIGRHVTLGAAVHLLAENHVFHDPDRPIVDQGVSRRGITIDDDVWIGNAAIVLDGVRVGRGAVVGAGAVVTRDVPSLAIVAGNPARIVGVRGGQPVRSEGPTSP